MPDFGDTRRTVDDLDLFAAAAQPACDSSRLARDPAAAVPQTTREPAASESQRAAAAIPLSDKALRLVELLRTAVGPDRAVTSAAAAAALGIAGRGQDQGREIRELVQLHYPEIARALFEATGLLLVAEAGYYLTGDPDVVEHYLRTLLSRGRCILDRAAAVADIAAAARYPAAAAQAAAISQLRRHLTAVSP